MEPLPLNSIAKDFFAFLSLHKTVVLGTLNKAMEAEASYAPVLQNNGRFYIYISELAKHSHNLLENKQLTLLFIQDEQDADNIFARKRATIKAHARHIDRDTVEWNALMDDYCQYFGDTAKMLRGLSDFHLFELSPTKASFVRGFAQAYELEGDLFNDVRHMNDRAHGKSTLDTGFKAT